MVLTRYLLAAVVALRLLAPSPAAAERATTRDALDRFEELLEIRLEDGALDRADLVPALVVSTRPRYEESQGWFEIRALEVLTRVLGADALRLCEACMRPRVFVQDGLLEQTSGPIGLDEVVRLDLASRGDAIPAKTAVWIDEHAAGIAVKFVDLATAQVVWAANVDPTLRESARTEELMQLTREYERRAKGESLTQVFFDAGLFPGQHVSLDWTDQWGETNKNFTGFSVSLFDPVLGVGAVYYRAFDLGSVFGLRLVPQLGVKVVMSVPTAIVQAVSSDGPDIIDPVLTGVGILRIPIGRSNYGILLTGSTNGRFGLGISLLNITFIPVVL